jgi:hypothetical protein
LEDLKKKIESVADTPKIEIAEVEKFARIRPRATSAAVKARSMEHISPAVVSCIDYDFNVIESVSDTESNLSIDLPPALDRTKLSPMSRLRRRLSSISVPNIFQKLPAVVSVASASPAIEQSSPIDIYSRRIFPLLFIILNSIYWLAYTYYITDDLEEPIA